MSKIITVSNSHHDEMFKCLDDEVFKYSNTRIECYKPERDDYGQFGTHTFFDICLFKIQIIIDCLNQLDDNATLIYLDSDIHVRDNVVHIMNDELIKSQCDILFQRDAHSQCAGMFICKKTQAIIDFFNRVYSQLQKDPAYYIARAADQTAIYEMLIQDTNQISHGYLSHRFTTYGNLRSRDILWEPRIRRFTLPKDLVAFHANFTIGTSNKKQLLKLVRRMH